MNRRAGRTIVRWLTTVVLLAGAVVVGWYGYQRLVWPRVTVTEVVEGPVVQAFYATGTLSPDREYPVRSAGDGVVTEVLVDKGSAVKAGQKLAFVRVEDYQMRFSQAQADLELKRKLARDDISPVLLEYNTRLQAAREQLEIAQRELQRIAELRASNVAAQADYDHTNERVQNYWREVESIKTQKATRKLELERDATVAQAAQDNAKWDLDQQTIVAPVDGVVLDRPVSVGTRVKVNDHLMQVADVAPHKLVMRAAVDEEDKTHVVLGQKVKMTLYAYGNRLFVGTVKQIYPKADPDRRTFEVDVAMAPNDPGFSAGMTGELAFIVASKDQATVVPTQAVRAGNVWLVRDGKLEQAPVKMGLRSVERTEILEGVRLGERVVVSVTDGLQPGQQVKTVYLDPAAAAGLNKPAEEKVGTTFN